MIRYWQKNTAIFLSSLQVKKLSVIIYECQYYTKHCKRLLTVVRMCHQTRQCLFNGKIKYLLYSLLFTF